MELYQIYLKAVEPLTNFFKDFINAILPNPIQFKTTGFLDFFNLGFTDLQSLLIFLFNFLLFIFLHYLIYKFIKWCVKTIGGISYVRR